MAAARSPRWLRSMAPTVQYPYAGLIMDSSGNLYGTTAAEARSERRHGFRAGPRQRHDHHAGFVQRHRRCNPASRPDHGQQRQPVRHNGLEGVGGDGTVFELAQGSGTITTLASFNGTNGAYPQAGLIMDSSGNLYGTTDAGRRLQRRHGFRAGHMAAARSPRWLRSTAPTVHTRKPP